MKKGIGIVVVILLLLLALVYLLIPNTISIRSTRTVEANAQASFRTLLDPAAWEKWWPGEKKMRNGHLRFFYNGYFYSVIDQKTSALVIAVADEEIQATTLLNFFSDTQGQVVLSWEGLIPATLSPSARVSHYFKARSLKTDLSVILKRMGDYFSKPEKVYTLPITEEHVVDSILVSTYDESVSYPTTASIYHLVHELEQYVNSHSAKVTGLPMLNVSTSDSIHFLTRVALPVDRQLPSSGKISYKWMLGGGKILVTEVKGGPYAISQAFHELELFVNDNKRIAPAIPFQSLVTDRSKEPDTAKWVTRIYYPVM